MGHIYKGDPQLFLQALELDLHLLAKLQVQRAQGLIQQKHSGVVDQRPRNGDALLLAAGQGIRLTLFIAGHLHQRQHLGNPALDLILGHLADGGSVSHVIKHRHVGEQGVALENGVYVALIGFLFLYPLALHLDGAGCGIFEACNHAQGCGFSAAGRPQ